jgi:hypothetical protein
MGLDDKLWAIINHHTESELDRVEQIKQAFTDDKTWHLDLQKFEKDGQPLMTGQEWYDRFTGYLWKPPKQEIISHDDDWETHDRFYRAGGQNFMYNQAIEAAKRAARIKE